MKSCLLIFVAAMVGCSQQNEQPDIPHVATADQFTQKAAGEPLPEPALDPAFEMVCLREPIEDIDKGGWVLNDQWKGFMGVAIKFSPDGKFKHWFYSDVRLENEPKQPTSGTWSWNGSVLELKAGDRPHDVRWYVYRFKDELALLPEYARRWQLDDGKPHDDRLLFQVLDFDENRPFASQWKELVIEEKLPLSPASP